MKENIFSKNKFLSNRNIERFQNENNKFNLVYNQNKIDYDNDNNNDDPTVIELQLSSRHNAKLFN